MCGYQLLDYFQERIVKIGALLRLLIKYCCMKPYFLFLLLIISGCKEEKNKMFTAQQIIDKSIEASGGARYENSQFSFDFRDKKYMLVRDINTNGKLLLRMFETDSSSIVDTKGSNFFTRVIDGVKVEIADSLAQKYANSINSVHYFAYLPYGLNDAAVNKELIGETVIKNKEYYKVKVTFDQLNGGDDFDDVYIYWFNKQSFIPDYLAYEFHVDGGGMRFREAINERTVNGIRFVDYKNYKPVDSVSIYDIEELFKNGKLDLLSKIELTSIEVTPIE